MAFILELNGSISGGQAPSSLLASTHSQLTFTSSALHPWMMLPQGQLSQVEHKVMSCKQNCQHMKLLHSGVRGNGGPQVSVFSFTC